MKKSIWGLSENVVSGLSYVFGWVSGLVAFVLERDSKVVRYNALQSVIWFGGLSIAGVIAKLLAWIPLAGPLLVWVIGTVGTISWFVLVISAFTGRTVKIPIIGDAVETTINK
ncbi:membrane protein [Clostridia bacterium]|nr:membrane protein [Clostridia bacterium]